MYNGILEQWEITQLIRICSTEQHTRRPTQAHHFITDFISQPVFRHALSTSSSSRWWQLTSINENTERSVHRHRHIHWYAKEIAFVWRHILCRVVDCPAAAFRQHYLQPNRHNVMLNNNISQQSPETGLYWISLFQMQLEPDPAGFSNSNLVGSGFGENLFRGQRTICLMKVMASTMLSAATKWQYCWVFLCWVTICQCFNESCTTAMNFVLLASK